jgi:hypothetical protein
MRHSNISTFYYLYFLTMKDLVIGNRGSITYKFGS